MTLSSIVKFSVAAALLSGSIVAKAQVKLVPQYASQSCWAASVEMVTGGAKTQHELLRGVCEGVCDGGLNARGRASCERTLTRAASAVASLIGNNYKVVRNPLSYQLFDTLTARPSVLCYEYGGSSANQHMVVLHGQALQPIGKRTERWIRVFDPFPICKGLEYYISYEQYVLAPRRTIAKVSGEPLSLPGSDTRYIAVVRNSASASAADPQVLAQNYVATAEDGNEEFRRLVGFNASRNPELTGESASIIYRTSAFLIESSGGRSRRLESLAMVNGDAKMYFIKCADSTSALYISKDENRWFLSRIENGARYLIRPASQPLPPIAGMPDENENLLLGHLKKNNLQFLSIRLTDLNQEYVFAESQGRIVVYDPYGNFTTLLPDGKSNILGFAEFRKYLSGYRDERLKK